MMFDLESWATGGSQVVQVPFTDLREVIHRAINALAATQSGLTCEYAEPTRASAAFKIGQTNLGGELFEIKVSHWLRPNSKQSLLEVGPCKFLSREPNEREMNFVTSASDIEEQKKRIRMVEVDIQQEFNDLHKQRQDYQEAILRALFYKMADDLDAVETSSTQKRKPGRPKSKHIKWAYEQVCIKRRDAKEVYPEWKKLLEKMGLDLAEPRKAFARAIRQCGSKGTKTQ